MDILMQEQEKEDKKNGWILVKKVKWPIRELYERKLKHNLSAWLKKEEAELSEAEYGKRSIGEEMEVDICQP